MISNQAKSQNAKYTNECREIFNNIKFAKIEKRSVYHAVIIIIFTIVLAILLTVCCFGIYNFCVGQSSLIDYLPAYILTIIWFILVTIIYGIYIRESCRKIVGCY